jgi:hypothetical protein
VAAKYPQMPAKIKMVNADCRKIITFAKAFTPLWYIRHGKNHRVHEKKEM